MGKYDGKRLLMLGSNVASADIVKYARGNGAYTIVADYYPSERSEAKRVANEAVLCSTCDLDALETLIRERKVDAVLSGISELNLLNAMELCERCGLPFYCTRAQWDKVERKDLFRQLCQENDVPCPQTYCTGTDVPDAVWAQIQYPVVVKPVDECASRGVYICNTEEELRQKIPISQGASSCGRIILEKFASGVEFTAHYTIADGRVTLSCVDDRYPVAVHEGSVTTVPVARIFPCLFLDAYIRQVDPGMKKLCRSLQIKDAIVFIQGIYDQGANCFFVFEAGLRSAAEAPYRFISYINGINPMEVIVDHAFGVRTSFASEREDPALKGKCCGIVSFVARGGVVEQINGLEEAIAATPSVIDFESRYPVGSKTPDTDTLRQLMIRFVMVCDSRDQMARDIGYLNEHITVLDDAGNDMVIKMLPERVFGIW